MIIFLRRNIQYDRTIERMIHSHRYRSLWINHRRYYNLQYQPQRPQLTQRPQQRLLPVVPFLRPFQRLPQQSTTIRSFTSSNLIDPDRCNKNVLYR